MRLEDFESTARSPFTVDHRYIRPFPDYDVNKSTGEVKEKSKLGDFQEHIRIFPEAYADFKELNSMAIQIISFIFSELSDDSDIVVLNAKSLMEMYNVTSRNSVLRGIKDLLIRGFIARKNSLDTYFVNPSKLFKGSRVKWYKNFLDEK
jgi:hypothetical protein